MTKMCLSCKADAKKRDLTFSWLPNVLWIFLWPRKKNKECLSLMCLEKQRKTKGN